TPGILFKLFLISYFIFRFLIEFIRVNPIIYAGLSIYQILSVLAAIYLSIGLWLRYRKESNLSSRNSE
ncbi:MAG: prolipoprotein diacylglyceryl transferase, partial [Erysipelotrichaceae bacterium]|nr:prolipoprotein diacylglyceryl transferase [Erysipelotrichaceae bacterium]